MSSDPQKPMTREEQREAVKASFRQRDESIVVIPADKKDKELLKQTEETIRVGLYSRVSTDNIEQASSIALQEVSFEDIARLHPNWELVETYTDEGISGTSTARRKDFQRMIADAEAGKLDLIVTRSVSRFARNLLDCVHTYRHLAALKHPVYVYFVSNNIITNGQGEQSEMILNFMAMIAQEESHIKSEVMNASIEQRFNAGKFLFGECFGFDRRRDSPWERPYLVINPEEAEIVREIFALFLIGHSPQKIAEMLMEEGRLTKKKHTTWTATTVVNILRNEKYYGALFARKTYTPNYLDHKSKRNRGERNRYRKENHHPAIISKEIWKIAEQILNSRSRGKGHSVRVLSVVKQGILRGFVQVERGYMGTGVGEYIDAYRSAYPGAIPKPKQVELSAISHFDLSGYESVSAVMFGKRNSPTMTIDFNSIVFNAMAVKRMDSAERIEVLFNPKQFEIAIRAAGEGSCGYRWYNRYNGGFISYRLQFGSFTTMLFDYMEWNSTYKYKVYGECREHKGEKLLFFSLRDIEILVPSDEEGGKRTKYKSYFPKNLLTQYGEDAYQAIYSTRAYLADYFRVWNACVRSVVAKEDELEAQRKAAVEELMKKETED